MKKLITNKTEKALADAINFRGKYVESLIKSAQNWPLVGADCKILLQDFYRKRRLQAKRVADSWKMSVAEYNRLQEKAKAILKDFHTGHSMGCHRTLSLMTKQMHRDYSTQGLEPVKELGMRLAPKDFAHNSVLDEYARSCKWSPTYGSLNIQLTKKQLREIQNIEGVWTMVGEEVHDGVCAAKWLSSEGWKNRYKLVWVEGFVCGSSHGKSVKEAVELETAKINSKINEQENNSRFIGYNHIRKIACDGGIKAFCARHNLNPDFGYNLGFLKSLGDRIGGSYLQKL